MEGCTFTPSVLPSSQARIDEMFSKDSADAALERLSKTQTASSRRKSIANAGSPAVVKQNRPRKQVGQVKKETPSLLAPKDDTTKKEVKKEETKKEATKETKKEVSKKEVSKQVDENVTTEETVELVGNVVVSMVEEVISNADSKEKDSGTSTGENEHKKKKKKHKNHGHKKKKKHH
jgi:hypothetical protein